MPVKSDRILIWLVHQKSPPIGQLRGWLRSRSAENIVSAEKGEKLTRLENEYAEACRKMRESKKELQHFKWGVEDDIQYIFASHFWNKW